LHARYVDEFWQPEPGDLFVSESGPQGTPMSNVDLFQKSTMRSIGPQSGFGCAA